MSRSPASRVLSLLPFSASVTPLQALTYLLCVCLFSISFLVFLNSSVSFVITDLLGIDKGVGNIVGTLGFVDELVALVACPIWGVLSDRLGVRTVCAPLRRQLPLVDWTTALTGLMIGLRLCALDTVSWAYRCLFLSKLKMCIRNCSSRGFSSVLAVQQRILPHFPSG